MYCKHCGSQIEESAMFCPTCGKIVEVDEFVAADSQATDHFDSQTKESNYFENGYNPPVERESGGGILGFAIAGLALACTFFLSFVGVIFAFIAKAKMNNYIERYGELDGPGKVGRGIGRAAMIVGWIFTGLFTFIILILGLAAGALLV